MTTDTVAIIQSIEGFQAATAEQFASLVFLLAILCICLIAIAVIKLVLG